MSHASSTLLLQCFIKQNFSNTIYNCPQILCFLFEDSKNRNKNFNISMKCNKMQKRAFAVSHCNENRQKIAQKTTFH